MATISIDYKELEELRKKFEALASDAEISQVERKIVKTNRDIAAERMKSKVPKSKNNAKTRKCYKNNIQYII